MFPLKRQYTFGYKHGQKTFYNASHIGVDLIIPEMTPIYAPEDGKVNHFSGTQGGQWLSLATKTGHHRFAHIKQYKAAKGSTVRRGDIVAYSGGARGAWYSGNSTNPHVHWDYNVNGVYVDPMTYSWDNSTMPTDQLSDHTVDGMPADKRIAELKDQVERYSGEITKLSDKINHPDTGIEALKKKLADEKKAHEETLEKSKSNYDKWQACLDQGGNTEAAEKLAKAQEAWRVFVGEIVEEI